MDNMPHTADTAGMDSRRKGAAGEREAAAAFEAATGIPCHRTAQRVGIHGDADISTAAPIHLESKRVARVAALKYLRQAERDAQTGRVPVAIVREDRDTEWCIVLRVRDVVPFANAVVEFRKAPIL
jgi:hypothetical protein